MLPAEEGCLQYFTGVSGQIKSYNYDPGAGLQLSNQDYSTCIRMERNFCGIQYTACPDTGKELNYIYFNLVFLTVKGHMAQVAWNLTMGLIVQVRL